MITSKMMRNFVAREPTNKRVQRFFMIMLVPTTIFFYFFLVPFSFVHIKKAAQQTEKNSTSTPLHLSTLSSCHIAFYTIKIVKEYNGESIKRVMWYLCSYHHHHHHQKYTGQKIKEEWEGDKRKKERWEVS